MSASSRGKACCSRCRTSLPQERVGGPIGGWPYRSSRVRRSIAGITAEIRASASDQAGTAQGKSKRDTYATGCFSFMLSTGKVNDCRACAQTFVDFTRSTRSRRATAEIRASRWNGWGRVSRSRRSSGEQQGTGFAGERPEHRHWQHRAATGPIGGRLAPQLCAPTHARSARLAQSI